MDVEVRRGADGSLKTAVFRKATHTDRYLDFKSYHSVQHKESVIRSLVLRGNYFPSDEADRSAEIRHVNRTLRENNYPKTFIQRTRRKIQRGQTRTENVREEVRRPVVVLPYVQGVTERVTRVLAPHAKVTNRPDKNLRSLLVKQKDKRDKISSAGVVYQYNRMCDYGASEARVVFRRLTEISEYERPAGRPAGRGHAFQRLISQQP